MNRPPKEPQASAIAITPFSDKDAPPIAQTPIGIGEISESDYHSEQAIHYSLLKHYARSADNGYFESWQEDTTTPAMKFGSLVHALALSPGTVNERYIIEEKKIALKKDGTPYANGMQDRDQAEAWAAAEAEGKYIFDPATYASAEEIAASAARCINGIYHGIAWHTELAAWTTLNGQKYKCKFDAIARSSNRNIALDIKTTAADITNEKAILREFFSFGYHIQAALYSLIFRNVLSMDIDGFSFIFVSKSAPYISRALLLTKDNIARYIETDLTQALNNYSRATRADYTPTYTLAPITINPEN